MAALALTPEQQTAIDEKAAAQVTLCGRVVSMKAISDAIPGVSRQQVWRHLSRTIGKGSSGSVVASAEPERVIAPPLAPVPEPDPVELARERMERQRRIKQEREDLHAVAGERSIRAELQRLARETAEHLAAPPPWQPTPAPKGASHETMLLMLSDWHAYEIVSRERTQGFNEYNAEIFARRSKRIIDRAISIKQRMEAGGGWVIDDCVISANGDFTSGSIHELERHTDAPNIVMAVYGCARTLALGLRDLAAVHRKVSVICTSGNHGRLPDARKMQKKDPTRNWDTMIYLLAESMLESVPNVEFFIPDSYVATFDIGEHTFIQYHGQGIRSWMGIPHYGISRWTRNNKALNNERDRKISYYLLSHFHQESSIDSGKTKVNGSLIGGNEYTVEDLNAADAPSQKMMLVHPEHGIRSDWSLEGDPPRGEPLGATYPVYPWERRNAS
jgi:hypothetical protein